MKNEVSGMTYSEVIAKRILSLCEEQQITISKLADLAGMSKSIIYDIVHNRTKIPRMKTLCFIARGFGVTISEFLDFPEMNNTKPDDFN